MVAETKKKAAQNEKDEHRQIEETANQKEDHTQKRRNFKSRLDRENGGYIGHFIS